VKKKDWLLTQEAFDNLLAWLDPDRERAGQKYEDIRFKLIRNFARRGCSIAEDLTDETINRVSRKALEIAQAYVGDPALYRSCEKKASCFSSEDEFSRCRRDLNGRKTAIDYEA